MGLTLGTQNSGHSVANYAASSSRMVKSFGKILKCLFTVLLVAGCLLLFVVEFISKLNMLINRFTYNLLYMYG